MRILIIGFAGEPASTWSCFTLRRLLSSMGNETVMALIPPDIEEITEGMFTKLLLDFDPGMVLAINLTRACMGSEFDRVRSFITWAEDWASWMGMDSMKDAHLYSGRDSDWILGYTDLIPGWRNTILTCFPMSGARSGWGGPELDVVSMMNKGDGWRSW